MSPPSRYQSSRVWTANECRRSWDAGSAGRWARGQSCSANQCVEGRADVDVEEPLPVGGNEQCWADRLREPQVTVAAVGDQRGDRGGLQRNQPLGTALGMTHPQQPSLDVEVDVVQTDRLTDA